MTLHDRIGIDIGRELALEDAVTWAAAHRVRFVDGQLDDNTARRGRLPAFWAGFGEAAVAFGNVGGNRRGAPVQLIDE